MTKFIGSVRQNFSLENRDIPLLSMKLFDTRNFKHRRVPLRNDSVLRKNNFDG